MKWKMKVAQTHPFSLLYFQNYPHSSLVSLWLNKSPSKISTPQNSKDSKSKKPLEKVLIVKRSSHPKFPWLQINHLLNWMISEARKLLLRAVEFFFYRQQTAACLQFDVFLACKVKSVKTAGTSWTVNIFFSRHTADTVPVALQQQANSHTVRQLKGRESCWCTTSEKRRRNDSKCCQASVTLYHCFQYFGEKLRSI